MGAAGKAEGSERSEVGIGMETGGTGVDKDKEADDEGNEGTKKIGEEPIVPYKLEVAAAVGGGEEEGTGVVAVAAAAAVVVGGEEEETAVAVAEAAAAVLGEEEETEVAADELAILAMRAALLPESGRLQARSRTFNSTIVRAHKCPCCTGNRVASPRLSIELESLQFEQ